MGPATCGSRQTLGAATERAHVEGGAGAPRRFHSAPEFGSVVSRKTMALASAARASSRVASRQSADQQLGRVQTNNWRNGDEAHGHGDRYQVGADSRVQKDARRSMARGTRKDFRLQHAQLLDFPSESPRTSCSAILSITARIGQQTQPGWRPIRRHRNGGRFTTRCRRR